MKILNIFKKTNALLEGHFVLSSGLHSEKYLQCALVLQYPEYAQALCKALAKKYQGKKIDVVIAPALGGILVSYELAKALGVRSIFTERKEGKQQLRRNFKIKKGENVLVCEDVITTGGSTKKVIDIVKTFGGKLTGIACIIDRSGKNNLFGKTKLTALKKMNIKTYSPENCPLCRKKIPLDKPGSRQ